jgi:hypothetical protein
MGLILDSSVVIAAERRDDTVEQLIEQIVNRIGDQEAALSAIGLSELIHGIYRTRTPEVRLRRESFLNELLADLTGTRTRKRPRCWPGRSTANSRVGAWRSRSETCGSEPRRCRLAIKC